MPLTRRRVYPRLPRNACKILTIRPGFNGLQRPIRKSVARAESSSRRKQHGARQSGPGTPASAREPLADRALYRGSAGAADAGGQRDLLGADRDAVLGVAAVLNAARL